MKLKKTFWIILISITISSYVEAQKNTSNNYWTYVEEYGAHGDGTDDSQYIQDAINSFKQISLMPGKTYHIHNTLEIGNHLDTNGNSIGQILNIPDNSTLIFDATSTNNNLAAIIIKSNGNLIGGGTLQSSRYTYSNNAWDTTYPKYGISILGARIKINLGYVLGFEYGIKMGGIGDFPVGYCKIHIQSFINNLYNIYINPTMPSWVNGNYIHWESINYGDDRTTFKRYGIFIDGNGTPNFNTFSGQIEGCQIGLHLSGAFNRFEGLRLERCDKKIQIVNGTPNDPTRGNLLFGEYGNYGEWTGQIENLTGYPLAEVLQIYGVQGENILNTIKYRNAFQQEDIYPYISNSKSSLDGSLDKISSLHAINYQTENAITSTNKGYGFNPEEIKKILPELVCTNIDSTYGINYIGLIPILVEAIKEQQNTINKLRAKPKYKNGKMEIESLKTELKDLLLEQQKEIDELKLLLPK